MQLHLRSLGIFGRDFFSALGAGEIRGRVLVLSWHFPLAGRPVRKGDERVLRKEFEQRFSRAAKSTTHARHTLQTPKKVISEPEGKPIGT